MPRGFHAPPHAFEEFEITMEYTAQDVKKLRDETGAGFADCKSALTEAGSYKEALTILDHKGAKRAEKVKAQERETRQGQVTSYIHHGGNLGVLLELNCSTDFVANSDEFRALARDLAMQIAGANPSYVARAEVSEDTLAQLREEAGGDAQLEKKLAEVVLLEQPWIKDPKVTIGQLVDGVIRKTGENVVIRRFARFALGE